MNTRKIIYFQVYKVNTFYYNFIFPPIIGKSETKCKQHTLNIINGMRVQNLLPPTMQSLGIALPDLLVKRKH